MIKMLKRSLVGLVTGFMFMQLVIIPVSFGQVKKADPKLLDEIEGNYEFEFQGEVMVFVFSVEDGNMMGAPEGEAPEVMELMEGEEMKFIGFSPDGSEYQFAFARDEEGKITKCTVSVPAMGIDVEGIRIK